THAAELEGMPVPANGSLAGEVIRTGCPLVVEDASTDERSHQPMVSSGRMGPSLFVPLSVRGVAFGTLAVANQVAGRRLHDGDVRSYIFGLRPHLLAANQGLDEALDQMAHEFESTSGVTTVVELDESLEGPLAANAVHLVQLTREALSNVGRHAGAQTCRVSL